jgi:hypothetical protein
MLIHLAVPLAPAVELAGCNVEAPDEIRDLVPRIVRNRNDKRRLCEPGFTGARL